MPVSAVGQIPYAPSGSPSDFTAVQNQLLRQKRMAELLQQEALKPDTTGLSTPGAKMSIAQPLAMMAKALAGSYLGSNADEAERTNAQGQNDLLNQTLADIPQGTPGTPAVPGTPGTPAVPAAPGAYGPTPDNNSDLAGSLLQGPGTTPPLNTLGNTPPPMLPTSPLITPQSGGSDAVPGTPGTPAMPAVPPSPQDWLKWGTRLANISPAGAKIGDQFTGAAAAQLLPKNPRDRYLPLANGDTLDLQATDAAGNPKYLAAGPETLAKQALAEKAQKDANEAKAAARADAATKAQNDNDVKLQIAQAHNDNALLLKSMVHALGGVGKTTDAGVDATNGMPVVRDQSGRRLTIDSATGKVTPYTGEVIPQAVHEKNVANYMAAETEAKMAEQAVAAIKDPAAADAFNWKNRGLLGLGASPSQAGVSAAGQKALAYVGRDFAETTKRLYGSSFTDGEQKRAAGFTITSKDDAESAAIKAQNAADFAREMAAKYGGAAAAAAARRMNTTPAAGGGAAWGKAEKQ